jgi:hypothetical protein
MALLDEIAWHCPQAAAFVVMDVDYPAVDSLALELGAVYVHSPQASRGELPALVTHAMNCLVGTQGNTRKPGRKKTLLTSEDNRDASGA